MPTKTTLLRYGEVGMLLSQSLEIMVVGVLVMALIDVT